MTQPSWPAAPEDKPLDFPDHWVVHRWFAMPEEGLVADVVPRIANTLAEARAHIPSGHTRNIWDRRDDPFLHEAWATPDFAGPP